MSTASPQEQLRPVTPASEQTEPPGPEQGAQQEVPPRNQEEAELLEAMKKSEGDEGAAQAAETKVDQTAAAAEGQSAKKMDDVLMQAKDLAPDVADAYRDSVQKRVSEVKAAAGRTKDAIRNVLVEAAKALKTEEKKLSVMEQAAATGKHGAWAEQKVEEQRQKVEEAKLAVAEVLPIIAPETTPAPTREAAQAPVDEQVAAAAPVDEQVAAVPSVVETIKLDESAAEAAAMAAGNLKSLDLETPEAAPIPLVTKKVDAADPIPLVTKKEMEVEFSGKYQNQDQTEPMPLVTKKEVDVSVTAEAAVEVPKLSREEIKKQQEEWRGHLKTVMDWRQSMDARKATMTKSEQAYYNYSATWEAVAEVQESLAEAEGKLLDAQEVAQKEEAELAKLQEQLATKFEERQKMYEQQNAYNKQVQDLEKQAQQPDISEEKRAKIAYDMKRARGEQAVLRSHIDDIGHEMQSLETDRSGIEERLKAAQSKVEALVTEREALVKEKTAAEATELTARTQYEAAEASFQKEAATAMAAAVAVETAAAAVTGEKAEVATKHAEAVNEKAYEMGKDDKLHEEKITMGDLGSYAARNSGALGAGVGLAGGAAVAGGVMGAKGIAKVGERAFAGIASIFYNAADLLDDLRHWKPDTFNRWKKGFSDNIRDQGIFRGMWRGAGEVAFGSYDKRMEELDKGKKMREQEENEKKVKAGGGGGSGSYHPGSTDEYPSLEKTDIETQAEKAERQKEGFINWAKQYGGSAEWVEETFTFDGETITVDGDLDFRVLNLPVDPTQATSFDGVLKVNGKVRLSYQQRNYEGAFAGQGLTVEVEPEPIEHDQDESTEAPAVSTEPPPPQATGGAATTH